MSCDKLYSALGLQRNATDEQIRKAFRQVARTAHPDLNPGDKVIEARFRAAAQAYAILGDPAQRERYDRGEIDETGLVRARPDPAPRDSAPHGSAAPRRQGVDRNSSQPQPAGDIYEQMFSEPGATGSFDWTPSSGASARSFDLNGGDQPVRLDIGFLEAARGGLVRLDMPGGGAVQLRIPPGTRDGQRLRLRGHGAADSGLMPQDIHVTLAVQPHDTFLREGHDIHLILPITESEAAAGARVPVPTLDSAVRLTLPRGARTGQRLRLRGCGIRPDDGAAPGDQFVELKIIRSGPMIADPDTHVAAWRAAHISAAGTTRQ